MLPTFVIIGAGKCGTSSLFHYLMQHPDVSGPANKETNFFSRDRTEDDLRRYARSLGDGEARGEASPRYTMWPRWLGVPERIKDVVPDVRLIYIVGDPIRKFTGTYREGISIGAESRPLDQALASVDDPERDRYLVGCRFGQQLARYRERFAAEQVLVIDQDDLRDRREQAMMQVYNYVGVDPERGPRAFRSEVNTAADQRDWSKSGRAIRRGQITTAFRRVPPRYRRPFVLAARAALSKPIPAAELTEHQREFLKERLRDDMTVLRSLTRADLGAGWQV